MENIMNDKIVKMRIGFSSIVIFRDILKNKVIKKLIKFLEAYDDDKNDAYPNPVFPSML